MSRYGYGDKLTQGFELMKGYVDEYPSLNCLRPLMAMEIIEGLLDDEFDVGVAGSERILNRRQPD